MIAKKPRKPGHGSNGKSIVVDAVVKSAYHFGRIRFQVIPICSDPVLEAFINENTDPGSLVVTDGWKGFYALDPEKYNHEQLVASHIIDFDKPQGDCKRYHP